MTMREGSRGLASEPQHEPVLAAEVVRLMQPRASGFYVDCTLGLGGHTAALVAAGAGRVLALDRDEAAVAAARVRLQDIAGQVEFVHDDYRRLPDVLAARGVTEVDGMLVDLGVSSMQLDDPARGFSFRQAGPLDMRLDRSRGATLGERLAAVGEADLTEIIQRFGEERHARRVARAILAARDRGTLRDTGDLAAAVRRAAGGRGWQRIDPATRTFQALRIWVNDELDGLEVFLDAAWRTLARGGRLLVLAFHSLEDRVVKHTFRRLAAADPVAHLLTRRPIVPDEAERERNPRSRSARLRALEKFA
jgi:16S rRNA (cytosine1402-N4)-methyltransferase